MKRFTIGILLYGDYDQLASRCLSSLLSTLSTTSPVADIRIGLNACSDSVKSIVEEWCALVAVVIAVRIVLYEVHTSPALKYPMMRQMVHDPSDPLADYFMWFDDDSFLRQEAGITWWERIASAMLESELIGEIYTSKMSPGQERWIEQQAWFNPESTAQPGRRFVFCTGGWFTIRSWVLKRFNYPFPELRHNGGDVLLGELVNQQGLRMGNYSVGVEINKEARRGYSETPFADNYRQKGWKPLIPNSTLASKRYFQHCSNTNM